MLGMGIFMQVLIHQQMNIISAAVMLFFIIYSYNVFDKKLKLNKLYLTSLILNLLLIILDTILAFLIGKDSTPLLILTRLIRVLIIAIVPYLTFIFLKIVCNYFPKPFKIKNSTQSVFYILMLINATLAISALFNPKVLNKIVEGTVPLLLSIFAAYSIFVIIKSKKMVIRFEFVSILAIALIAIAIIFAQIIANTSSSSCYGNTMILVFMFVIIQQRELYRDSLTGARNRVVLKKCIDAHANKPNDKLAAIMVDLDYFKSINDSFGHSEGDYALKTFVKILQRAYSDHGVVIRMGGDEFLILIDNVSTKEINEMIMRMSKMIDSFNGKSEKPYHIRYSYASGVYDNRNVSIEQFIHDLDMKMYQNKKGKRERIWGIKNM